MASVQCTVIKGDLPLEITWMFGDHPVGLDQRDIVISSSSKRLMQLTIEDVAAKHAGEYTCVASNAAGSVSQTAVLEVNGIRLIYNLLFSKPHYSLVQKFPSPIHDCKLEKLPPQDVEALFI